MIVHGMRLSDACLSKHDCRECISGNQLKVDVADILSYNDDLAKFVEENPSESLPLVRSRVALQSLCNKMMQSNQQ